MSPLPLTPVVAALPATVPFVGPEAQERARGAPFRARLGANESGFGPSPRAVAAMAEAAANAWCYGDPENHDLREALAALHGVPPPQIAVGEGIDGLLHVLAHLTVSKGTPVVTSAGAYPTFVYHVKAFGGRPVTVPYRDDCEDADALVDAAIATGAPLVYLANPDNPMGTFHGRATIERALYRLPKTTILALDEAYSEFVPDDALLPPGLNDTRLVRLRTFSKAHGLAGARVGYAIGTEALVSACNRVRNHFGVNRIGQAGALAALGDTAHLANVQRAVAAAKGRIAEIAAQNGLTALESHTNFVAVDTGGDGAFAKTLVAALGARGVFVRMPFVAPQNRCIRISAGPAPALDALADALPAALEEVRALSASTDLFELNRSTS
ncbi:MAG: pyridoxal phosphate-dependent aminotransferase [Pseudomonadota bacterium]